MSVEVLLKAIELMEEGKKWTNNINAGPKDCYCLYTAMVEAHYQVMHQHCEYMAWPSGLERVLSAGKFTLRSDVFYWNDRVTRTWEDIKDLLERAITQPFIPPELNRNKEQEGMDPGDEHTGENG